MQVESEEHVCAFYAAADPSPRARHFANRVFTLPSDAPAELAPFDSRDVVDGDGGGGGGDALADTLPRKARLDLLANGTRNEVRRLPLMHDGPPLGSRKLTIGERETLLALTLTLKLLVPPQDWKPGSIANHGHGTAAY